MAEPSFLSDGATPRVADTRWRVLAKVVGKLFDATAGVNAANAPNRTDTRWKLLRKWNRIKNGS